MSKCVRACEGGEIEFCGTKYFYVCNFADQSQCRDWMVQSLHMQHGRRHDVETVAKGPGRTGTDGRLPG